MSPPRPDEPASALDPELVSERLDVIRRVVVEDGLTMTISTHQLSFAREVADRVVFLNAGQVADDGPADEVPTRPRHPLTARAPDVSDPECPDAGRLRPRVKGWVADSHLQGGSRRQ
jgi:ABC-type glutathione transport system ATPase component